MRERLAGLLADAASSGAAVAAAGCPDPFTARIAREAGFDVVYMTGNGASAVRLGEPDVGLLTLPEMVDQASRIASAVDVPLVADADTGYGSALNVMRVVAEYGRGGVAAMHLEDQQMPKRCGHLEGKQLVDPLEHAGRIEAAVAASGGTGPLVIARTDALSAEGEIAAVERARLYGEAGADLLFVEGMQDAEQIARVAEELGRWPLVHAWVEGRSPDLTVAELGTLGVRLVIHPLTAVLSILASLRRTYERLLADGRPTALMEDLATFEQFNDFMGAEEAALTEARYSSESGHAPGGGAAEVDPNRAG